ncbi:sensor histidine kinase [Marisediminicola sp. LYQ134]|uniref:sensor histidine kinase n=1 Tax=Marisediminicola sp. LYQ134 TaxID=3391061 RepID=UPI003982F507
MTDRRSSVPPQRSTRARPVAASGAEASRAPLPAALPAPPLQAWSRIWRYLLVLATGALFWIFTLAEFVGFGPDELSERDNAVITGFMLLDLVLGGVAVALLPLRRRHPVTIAVITAGLSSVSVFSIGAAMLAIVSMSTRRRWRPVVAVGVVWIACTVVYEFVVRPSVAGEQTEMYSSWASGGIAIAVYGILVATGFYVGARRDLLASLRERALNAEREQALREESAREAERTRIAREMHDVLAHHISLVSLHAGALTYRTDLTRDETAQAATVIQNNAQLALTELRQILGVLRSSEGGSGAAGGAGAADGADAADGGRADAERLDARVEPPQPTLADLPALLDDSREAGTDVTLDAGVTPDAGDLDLALAVDLEGLGESVSRTAYRIIQEALTNARKHAPGAPVTVELERRDAELRVTVRNPVRQASVAGTRESGGSGSGVGLTGLQERAELAGGSLAHGVDRGDHFVVTARLPWE